MPASLNLEIGGLTCRLEIESSHWAKFLRKKYQPFLKEKKIGQFELRLGISSSKRSRKFQLNINSDDWNSAILHCPDNLRLFRKVDFFFKKFYGSVLSRKKGFLLHASSLNKGARGYIFSGRRKAGKSTILKLLPKYQGLADDTTIIRKSRQDYLVFGSPFYDSNKPDCGKVSFLISGVYFLVHSEENHLNKLKVNEAIERLIVNVFPCKFSPEMNRVLLTNLWNTCYDFVSKIPVYLLFFKKDSSFWHLIEKNHG